MHEPGEAYAGPATLSSGAQSWQVDVVLRGTFQPIDGRFHWYGRLSADAEIVVPNGTEVSVRTPAGDAVGTLSDPDPWGRLRLAGTGRPPF